MNQIQTENSFYTTPSIANSPSDTDIPVEEWQLIRHDLMLMCKKEFSAYYEELEDYLKENENFDDEEDIGSIEDYPLSIDYIEPDVNDTPPYWQYLILYGGPGSEIRFFVNDKSSIKPYKVEFWFLESSNNRKQDVTGEDVIEHLWEQILLPLTEQIETQNEESFQFTLPLDEVLLQHKADAEGKAREAFVLELLRQGDISAGRAARLLNISRWDLSELMYEVDISPFDDSLTAETLDAEVKSALKDFDEPKS